MFSAPFHPIVPASLPGTRISITLSWGSGNRVTTIPPRQQTQASPFINGRPSTPCPCVQIVPATTSSPATPAAPGVSAWVFSLSHNFAFPQIIPPTSARWPSRGARTTQLLTRPSPGHRARSPHILALLAAESDPIPPSASDQIDPSPLLSPAHAVQPCDTFRGPPVHVTIVNNEHL